jgi:hypothetical protein
MQNLFGLDILNFAKLRPVEQRAKPVHQDLLMGRVHEEGDTTYGHGSRRLRQRYGICD